MAKAVQGATVAAHAIRTTEFANLHATVHTLYKTPPEQILVNSIYRSVKQYNFGEGNAPLLVRLSSNTSVILRRRGKYDDIGRLEKTRLNRNSFRILDLVQQSDTTRVIKQLRLRVDAPLGLSRVTLRKKLQEYRRKTLIVIGHIDNGYIVTYDAKHRAEVRVAIRHLEEDADNADVELLVLGCQSSRFTRGAGVEENINSIDIARRLAHALRASDYGAFLYRLARGAPGSPELHLVIEHSLLVRGRVHYEIRIRQWDQATRSLKVVFVMSVSVRLSKEPTQDSFHVDYAVYDDEIDLFLDIIRYDFTLPDNSDIDFCASGVRVVIGDMRSPTNHALLVTADMTAGLGDELGHSHPDSVSPFRKRVEERIRQLKRENRWRATQREFARYLNCLGNLTASPNSVSLNAYY